MFKKVRNVRKNYCPPTIKNRNNYIFLNLKKEKLVSNTSMTTFDENYFKYFFGKCLLIVWFVQIWAWV